MDEFVEVSGSGWARAFFILNYIMGVAVILNLVVTVVINSFWDEYKRTKQPKDTLRLLHNAATASARYRAHSQGHRSQPSLRDGGDGAGGGGGGAIVCGQPDCDGESGGATAALGDDGVGSRGRGEAGDGVGVGVLPPSPPADTGWGWNQIPVGQEEEPAVPANRSNPSSRRGSREGSGGLYSGRGQQPALPTGDEAGMNEERSIARRASRRRLDVSGIT